MASYHLAVYCCWFQGLNRKVGVSREVFMFQRQRYYSSRMVNFHLLYEKNVQIYTNRIKLTLIHVLTNRVFKKNHAPEFPLTTATFKVGSHFFHSPSTFDIFYCHMTTQRCEVSSRAKPAVSSFSSGTSGSFSSSFSTGDSASWRMVNWDGGYWLEGW